MHNDPQGREGKSLCFLYTWKKFEKGIDRLGEDVHNVRNRCPFRVSEILVLVAAVTGFIKYGQAS